MHVSEINMLVYLNRHGQFCLRLRDDTGKEERFVIADKYQHRFVAIDAVEEAMQRVREGDQLGICRSEPE